MILEKIKRRLNRYLIKLIDLLFLDKLLLTAEMPDFMVIGAQKSGTSTIHHLLNQHPKLKGSVRKELHYFDTPIHDRPGLEAYKKNFRKSILNDSLTFESTPKYIFVESIPKELVELKPDLKFILLLREPVSRAYSGWNMYRRIFDNYKEKNILPYPKSRPIYQYYFKGRSRFPSFEECTQIELENIDNGADDPAIIRRGLYHQQLKNYFQYFPREQFIILEYQDFVYNTEMTLNQIAAFLGVQPFNKITIESRNVGSYVSKINPDTKKMLKEFFRPPNEALFELLGKRFDW